MFEWYNPSGQWTRIDLLNMVIHVVTNYSRHATRTNQQLHYHRRPAVYEEPGWHLIQHDRRRLELNKPYLRDILPAKLQNMDKVSKIFSKQIIELDRWKGIILDTHWFQSPPRSTCPHSLRLNLPSSICFDSSWGHRGYLCCTRKISEKGHILSDEPAQRTTL